MGKIDKLDQIFNSDGTLNDDLVKEVATNIIDTLETKMGLHDVYVHTKKKIQKNGKNNYDNDVDPVEPALNADQKKDINNNFTDITTKELTRDITKMKLIVNLTYSMYNSIIDIYCERMNISKDDIVFVYKGGNVLRFIFQRSMKEFPAYSSSTVYKELEKFFGISDNDYSILINPNVKDYDNVFANMTAISYWVLCIIRLIMVQNLSVLYDYFDRNYETKKSIIAKRMPSAQKSISEILNGDLTSVTFGQDRFNLKESTQNETDTQAKSRNYLDVCLFNNGNQEDPVHDGTFEVDQYFMSDSAFPLRNSINEIIKFDWENGTGKTRFNLVRMKAMFPAEIILPGDVKPTPFTFSGEMIDVSIPYNIHYDRSAIVDYVDNSTNLKYRSYDFAHMIIDLEFILFDQLMFPWEVGKYEKRLTRITVLYCLNLTMFNNHADPEVKSMKDIILKFANINMILKNMVDLDNKNNIQQYANDLSTIFKSNKVAFKKFFKYINRIAKDTMRSDKVEANYVNFIQFLKNLMDNIGIMNSIFNKVQKFIDSKGELSENNLYRGLSGGVRQSLEFGDKLLAQFGYI
jgi:hypothetical protein